MGGDGAGGGMRGGLEGEGCEEEECDEAKEVVRGCIPTNSRLTRGVANRIEALVPVCM